MVADFFGFINCSRVSLGSKLWVRTLGERFLLVRCTSTSRDQEPKVQDLGIVIAKYYDWPFLVPCTLSFGKNNN